VLVAGPERANQLCGRRAFRSVPLPNPTAKGDDMKPSTKDQVEGKFHEMKGKVKEKTGQATNNPDLMDKGTVEKVSGKVQKKIGQVEKVFEK
jgi:uncharacterized protein YjbJ (UPF0337 family)